MSSLGSNMKSPGIFKVFIYAMLWVGYFLLQYYFLSYPFDTNAALILATRIVVIHAILFYVNSYLLLPNLLDMNRYALYFLSVSILLIATYFLFVFSHELSIINEALDTNRYRRARNVQYIERTFRTRIFISSLISSLAVLFISTTYWIIRRMQQRKQHEVNLINENLQTEMKFLKSQVNPHFLLNTLNNIYSLAHAKSPKTPDMILHLAEMLKYMLYGANAKKVTLGQEIKYIEDYIAFQKLKFEHEPAVTTDFSEANRELNLEPMLIIPFVENSFKHNDLEDQKNGFIKLSIKTYGNVIHLKLENSCYNNSHQLMHTGGIGLANVKRRLNLLYFDKHDLKTSQEGDKYFVDLTINT